ncbi:MAG: hypothetical protein AB8B52_00420 [Winogradskyella sp.]|uniref:hypothetical protein n=1 Tax=Winogradskyella sp. TaxID=1883156 RepID=UPI00385F2704
MKKIFILVLAAFFAVSCLDDSDEITLPSNEITNSLASGTVYGSDFTIGGGKVQATDFFDVPSFRFWMTEEALGCETLGFSGFPIVVTSPNTVGVHTVNTYATFTDAEADSFISFSSDITVEIISITDDLVVGKVRAIDSFTNNAIEGRFELPLCE